ncbi:MAG: hypothetical protein Tsb0017_10280 [Geothermobacteraceae bacterium]
MRWIVLFVMLLAAGCATQPHYQHHYSPTTDFSRYQSWKWADDRPVVADSLVGEDPLQRQVRQLVTAELEARGLDMKPQGADLLVSYRGNLFRPVAEYPGATGYSSQVAWEKRDGGWLRRSSQAASLTLMLIDAKTGQVVWTATGREPIEDERDAMRRLPGMIRTLLANFPPGRQP